MGRGILELLRGAADAIKCTCFYRFLSRYPGRRRRGGQWRGPHHQEDTGGGPMITGFLAALALLPVLVILDIVKKYK
jgi:hypothetical protein